jgi:hypothetical protein
MVSTAILVRYHADHFFAAHLCIERAAYAAISAGGGNRMFRQALLDDRFFHERRGGASLYTRATGYTFGIQEVIEIAGSYFGIKSTPFDRKRKCTLRFLTGTHTAGADDALGRVERELGV